MEATKTATRDYPSCSRTPWDLWEVIYARRSNRKYLPLVLEGGFIRSLEETVRLAASVRGSGEGSILVVTDRDRVERIRRKANKGIQGKINIWLLRTPVSGFLVMALPRADVKSERPRRLPLAAMAVEDTVLWLTEAGLGTCWMAGINKRQVRNAAGLGDETDVPAIISFGRPKARIQARDLDHMIYRRISRKRKPISGIAYEETINRPYVPGNPARESFSASETQDVAGLLRRLAGGDGGSGDVSLELAVEACLEAARVAPSGGNMQRWHFIVVTAEDRVRELARACGCANTWRAAVVGAGQAGGMEVLMLDKPFWMLDLPIAFSHMSLTAASMDLAVDLHVNELDERAVNEIVGLQPPLRTVGVLGLS